jgi:hypothetical protein
VAGACAGAVAAPNTASPRNIARTLPRIVFNTRIVPQLETLGKIASPEALRRTRLGAVSTPVLAEMQAVEGKLCAVYRQ